MTAKGGRVYWAGQAPAFLDFIFVYIEYMNLMNIRCWMKDTKEKGMIE